MGVAVVVVIGVVPVAVIVSVAELVTVAGWLSGGEDGAAASPSVSLASCRHTRPAG